jgi:hypothetical protein
VGFDILLVIKGRKKWGFQGLTRRADTVFYKIPRVNQDCLLGSKGASLSSLLIASGYRVLYLGQWGLVLGSCDRTNQSRQPIQGRIGWLDGLTLLSEGITLTLCITAITAVRIIGLLG